VQVGTFPTDKYFCEKDFGLKNKFYLCGSKNFNIKCCTNKFQNMTVSLNSQSRASIAKKTGISYEDLLVMDIGSIDAAIEKKIGKKLKYKPITDDRLTGRGSVYMYLNRFFDFNTQKLDRYIDRIK
jgi:hypothetical protein